VNRGYELKRLLADDVTVEEGRMTLQVAFPHWYSSDFTVWLASQPVVDGRVSSWRDKGALTISGVRYDVYRDAWMMGAFLLERHGSVIARAEKPSALLRRYVIRHNDREYTLEARSAFRRAFVLLDGSGEIGSIRPTGLFTRGATADLPDDWPLPLRAFAIWLTMMQWRRDRS
jgi:hypothetical protein